MNEDLIHDLDDEIGIEPADLEEAFTEAMGLTLGKQSAEAKGLRWTDSQENEFQERISDLLAEAKARGLSSLTTIVVRKATGERLTREIDLERVGRERRLQ